MDLIVLGGEEDRAMEGRKQAVGGGERGSQGGKTKALVLFLSATTLRQDSEPIQHHS